jgi:hypothetical protein
MLGHWIARRRNSAAVLLALLALAPLPALAHERWFVDNAEDYPIQPELLLGPWTLIGLAVSAAVVGALLLARRLAGGDNMFPRVWFLRRYDPSAPVVIAIQAAISLIYVAVNLRYFAVNLELPANLAGYVLAGAQLAVAFSFISGVFTRAGAALLIGLVLLAGLLYGPVAMLEQSIFVGIALYLGIMGRGLRDTTAARPAPHPLDRYRPLTPTLLRVFTALTIVALAFSEKLLNPALGVAFLEAYPNFNVARLLGFEWFTDERFVLAAGVVELAIGAALLSGVLPRLVIIGMFVPFNLPLPFLPPTELLGHLPIFAVMYVLLFHHPALRADAPEGPAVEQALQGKVSPEELTAREVGA